MKSVSECLMFLHAPSRRVNQGFRPDECHEDWLKAPSHPLPILPLVPFSFVNVILRVFDLHLVHTWMSRRPKN
jgi:hypothetical protein